MALLKKHDVEETLKAENSIGAHPNRRVRGRKFGAHGECLTTGSQERPERALICSIFRGPWYDSLYQGQLEAFPLTS